MTLHEAVRSLPASVAGQLVSPRVFSCASLKPLVLQLLALALRSAALSHLRPPLRHLASCYSSMLLMPEYVIV